MIRRSRLKKMLKVQPMSKINKNLKQKKKMMLSLCCRQREWPVRMWVWEERSLRRVWSPGIFPERG